MLMKCLVMSFREIIFGKNVTFHIICKLSRIVFRCDHLKALNMQNYDTFPETNVRYRLSKMRNRNLLVDILVIFFGIGAWVAINGLWAELPLIVQELPEGWNLPSYIAVVIQIANIGPIAYSLFRLSKNDVKSVPIIYVVLIIGCLASVLLTLFWSRTTVIGYYEHSTALLILVFFLSLVDCTSSVLYIPYMANWKEIYLSSYLIGEGLSGLIPGIVALVQGTGGDGSCINATADGVEIIRFPSEIVPNFSIEVYFYFLFAMMVASASAFLLLEFFPSIQGERCSRTESSQDLGIPQTSRFRKSIAANPMPNKMYLFLLFLVSWACMLSNGILPSIQSYSCGPYGRVAYHLTATLTTLANPIAAFSTMILPRVKVRTVSFISVIFTVLACYIFATAVMSPAPPLVDLPIGSTLIVILWVLFSGLNTYVRVEIANLMREEGEMSLFWAGVVTQAGSAVGAIISFILVNSTSIFTPYEPCA